ncbi:hypothetical protein M413DRAFT_392623 [Hebeloma cylindrosporum]|uniref:Uncharacterized protein n=1 Tax=Hebeloma cylindrosporum TaxID=76867 RepID=A0A0C2XZB4_HEBCY|nr:hypothetical protein M413DRAFT_392623 [Hebeloma cylindrosporum h7]
MLRSACGSFFFFFVFWHLRPPFLLCPFLVFFFPSILSFTRWFFFAAFMHTHDSTLSMTPPQSLLLLLLSYSYLRTPSTFYPDISSHHHILPAPAPPPTIVPRTLTRCLRCRFFFFKKRNSTFSFFFLVARDIVGIHSFMFDSLPIYQSSFFFFFLTTPTIIHLLSALLNNSIRPYNNNQQQPTATTTMMAIYRAPFLLIGLSNRPPCMQPRPRPHQPRHTPTYPQFFDDIRYT